MKCIYPRNYGFGDRIKTYLPNERISQNTPHVYKDDEEICLEHDDFEYDTDILDVMAWLLSWLVLYEEWRETGKEW